MQFRLLFRNLVCEAGHPEVVLSDLWTTVKCVVARHFPTFLGYTCRLETNYLQFFVELYQHQFEWQQDVPISTTRIALFGLVSSISKQSPSIRVVDPHHNPAYLPLDFCCWPIPTRAWYHSSYRSILTNNIKLAAFEDRAATITNRNSTCACSVYRREGEGLSL